MAESTTIQLSDPLLFKQKVCVWASKFQVFIQLDSCGYKQDEYSKLAWILAVDALDFVAPTHNSFESVQQFSDKVKQPIFGFWGYDCQQETHDIAHKTPSSVQFPPAYFFKPRYLFEIKGSKLTLNRNYPETFEIISQIEAQEIATSEPAQISFTAQVSHPAYIQQVEDIRSRIAEGDFYELNYCTEVLAKDASIDPVQTYFRLLNLSQSPFSALLKYKSNYALCASPERFVCKRESKLISQPIKGTIRRGKDIQEDMEMQKELLESPKERAENVMIVDLVRNDLTPYAIPGTIHVEELFGIKTFKTLHQMVSTVSANLRDKNEGVKALKNAFPMGSMTGAPKFEVMKYIRKIETPDRGLFSGTIGYIEADGDYDFNVVIRTIFYNSLEKIISIKTGSAITFHSNPEFEYEELSLKREALLKAVNGDVI